ncbi:MAG TPA: CPBP family intramembrane glutamic endopeptidase [Terriglobales bacterium]|nr:CPBP family intramembrane glutamic endopeptidase [Terriglobales bacterium]
MTTAAANSQITRGSGSNVGQVIAWIALLFALTVIGALPMLFQGLNLTRISQSTPHLPLVLMGMLVTSCSPTLAALFVTWLYPGAGGLRSVFRQARVWRVGAIWYAIALIGPVLLMLAAKAINAARLGVLPAQWMDVPSFSGPGGLPFIIFGSLLAEEPGWRGFAQPRLQVRYGALAASVFIGLLWSTWHLWYVILPGGLSNVSGTDAVATYMRLTSTAVIYAWMYNSTNGSLLIAMVAHFGHNLAASLIPTLADGGQQHLISALLYFVAAMIVVFTTDARTLRGPSLHGSSPN